MGKLFFKKAIFVLMAIFMFIPLAAAPASAATADEILWDNQKGEIQTETGLGDKDPRTIIAEVIRIILGFLGIIAVIIIIVGGFKWMTAGGDEGKVTEAKQMIFAGVIGLIIILSAFAIASFVTEKLFDATQ